jgi:hypothetical protein
MNSVRTARAAFKTTIPPATDATFTPNPASPQSQGLAVAFTAEGIGGSGTYEYLFRVRVGTTWVVKQTYSTNNIWNWDTTAVTPGTYLVQVRVRSAGTATLYDVYKQLSYTIIPAPVTDATLTPGVASPQVQGTQILFTAQGVGGTGNYEYQFKLYNATTGWTDVQAYSTTNTWTWNTTNAAAGTYQVQVRVRNVGSGVLYDVLKTVDYAITLPPVTDATLSPNPVSPQTAGVSVAFTAQGVGGTGVYEYQFRFKSSTTSWTEVQAYSTTNVWNWDTTGVAAGTYQVQVRVRNNGSGVLYDVYKQISYTIN